MVTLVYTRLHMVTHGYVELNMVIIDYAMLQEITL